MKGGSRGLGAAMSPQEIIYLSSARKVRHILLSRQNKDMVCWKNLGVQKRGNGIFLQVRKAGRKGILFGLRCECLLTFRWYLDRLYSKPQSNASFVICNGLPLHILRGLSQFVRLNVPRNGNQSFENLAGGAMRRCLRPNRRACKDYRSNEQLSYLSSAWRILSK